MPAVAAVALRYIIMAAVQLGMWWAIEKYGIPLINELIVMNMTQYGVPREDAEKIVGNQVVKIFEEVGIFALTLKSKLPIKVAEALGFTTRGFAASKLSQTLEGKIGQAALSATTKAPTTAAEIEKVAEVIAKGRGLNVGVVGSLWKAIMSNVSQTAIVILAFANVMDFGNWQGAYQKTFQKIFTALGFPPDSPMPKARTLSAETWSRIYNTIEELHPIGISFPVSGVDKVYSRNNLADMIDEVTAYLVKNKVDPTFKNVIGVALPLIQLSGQPATEKPYVVEAPVKTSTTTTTPVKVFIGTVSQGYLADGGTFTPRENDLIESTAELTDSAHNNLVPFLTSLPGRVTYELKIVSSIVDADGFRRTGTTQQVISGVGTDGKPKYRTVTNKFAVLDLYIKTATGSRAKISSIVLGPVDSVRLQIGASELASLSTALKTNIVTTQTNTISNVASVGSTITPAVQTTPTDAVTPLLTPGMFRAAGDFGSGLYARIGNKIYYTNLLADELLPNRSSYPNAGKMAEAVLPILKAKYNLDWNSLPVYNLGDMSSDTTIIKTGKAGPDGGPDPFVRSVSFSDFAALRETGPVQESAVTLSKQATTLKDYYTILGAELPSIEIRAQQYESLGLGPKSFYTGTAEQNTKLLTKLQGK